MAMSGSGCIEGVEAVGEHCRRMAFQLLGSSAEEGCLGTWVLERNRASLALYLYLVESGYCSFGSVEQKYKTFNLNLIKFVYLIYLQIGCSSYCS